MEVMPNKAWCESIRLHWTTNLKNWWMFYLILLKRAAIGDLGNLDNKSEGQHIFLDILVFPLNTLFFHSQKHLWFSLIFKNVEIACMKWNDNASHFSEHTDQNKWPGVYMSPIWFRFTGQREVMQVEQYFLSLSIKSIIHPKYLPNISLNVFSSFC